MKKLIILSVGCLVIAQGAQGACSTNKGSKTSCEASANGGIWNGSSCTCPSASTGGTVSQGSAGGGSTCNETKGCNENWCLSNTSLIKTSSCEKPASSSTCTRDFCSNFICQGSAECLVKDDPKACPATIKQSETDIRGLTTRANTAETDNKKCETKLSACEVDKGRIQSGAQNAVNSDYEKRLNAANKAKEAAEAKVATLEQQLKDAKSQMGNKGGSRGDDTPAGNYISILVHFTYNTEIMVNGERKPARDNIFTVKNMKVNVGQRITCDRAAFNIDRADVKVIGCIDKYKRAESTVVTQTSAQCPDCTRVVNMFGATITEGRVVTIQ